MEIAYAWRRAAFYPYAGPPFTFPPKEFRARWLKKIRSLNVAGIEIGTDAAGPDPTEAKVHELRKELDGAGVPCVSVRGGGGVTHPRTAAASKERILLSVRFAGWIGASVSNNGLTTPATDPHGPGVMNWGDYVSQGSSRLASEEDFVRTAAALREAGKLAADVGVDISIEVHQHSIADNSWGALHLLQLIDHPRVGVNPDLGNIYWTYDVPEETSEAAIVKLAPHTKYWHCKNLHRVHFAQLKQSYFVRVPLPDGDIDYRFALSAMHHAGYTGYIVVEGANAEGDQFSMDGRSIEYMRGLLREIEADGA